VWIFTVERNIFMPTTNTVGLLEPMFLKSVTDSNRSASCNNLSCHRRHEH